MLGRKDSVTEVMAMDISATTSCNLLLPSGGFLT